MGSGSEPKVGSAMQLGRVQSLVSGRSSRKKSADLDVLDTCVDILSREAGWESVADWRAVLERSWSAGSGDTAVTRAYFTPDLKAMEQRYATASRQEMVAMNRLGYKGNFGYQFFQYAALRRFADSQGLIPATSPHRSPIHAIGAI